MSGKIKTGSSTWSNVSEMRVKTSPSNWATVSRAYVKTAANTWSQWFLAPIRDTFTRTVSGAIGTANTGQTWETLSGTWFANGSQAQSDTDASTHPVARINYGDVTAIVSAAPSPGTGPAVWVNSSGDWYAAVLYQDQVNGTYPCNCTCNGHNEPYSNPIPCYCGANCSVCGSTSSTSTYTATATASGGYWRYLRTADGPYYSCSSGNVSGSLCYSCPTYPYVLWNGSSCTNLFSSSDTRSATYVGPATRYYTCPVGECCHDNINSCYEWVTTYTYSCNAGDGSPSGTTCYHTTTTCNSCYSFACGTCGYDTGTYFVSGGTYPNCDSYGSSCQSCGGMITRYFLRLLRSVGGVVTTLATDITLSQAPAMIKLDTSGGVLTYTAYSDTAMTTVLGSGSHTPTTPITSGYHGIVKSPAAFAQGSTVDNFSISG